MKKLLLSLALIASASFLATAQDKQVKETKSVVKHGDKETTTTVKDEKTTKKTSTVPQKVHNTFSDDKQYSGKKTKHKRTVEKKTTVEPAAK